MTNLSSVLLKGVTLTRKITSTRYGINLKYTMLVTFRRRRCISLNKTLRHGFTAVTLYELLNQKLFYDLVSFRGVEKE